MSLDKEPSPPPPYPGSSVYPLPMIPDLSYINDYLPWSIVNLLFGWGFFGMIPLIFSIVCRNNKNINNITGAQTMSSLALIFNILITIGGIIGWTLLIIFLYMYSSAVYILT